MLLISLIVAAAAKETRKQGDARPNGEMNHREKRRTTSKLIQHK
jgi:hypothetical protein